MKRSRNHRAIGFLCTAFCTLMGSLVLGGPSNMGASSRDSEGAPSSEEPLPPASVESIHGAEVEAILTLRLTTDARVRDEVVGRHLSAAEAPINR